MIKIKHNEGTNQEIAIRLVMQSCNGNEYFDDYESLEEMAQAASRLTAKGMIETAKDGIDRLVGFAVVARSNYGKDGLGHGLKKEEDGLGHGLKKEKYGLGHGLKKEDLTMETNEKLWEILVPTVRPDGRPIKTRCHRAWDDKVRSFATGSTILKPVKGKWVSPSDEIFVERMIPVRICCTEEAIEKIADMTAKYYEQKAVMFYLVSGFVKIKHYETPKKGRNSDRNAHNV